MWASRQPGSSSISSISRMADSRSTGMLSRTRLHALHRAAACQCLARSFPIRCAESCATVLPECASHRGAVHRGRQVTNVQRRIGVTFRNKFLPPNSFKCLFLHCCLGLAFTQAPLANSQEVFSMKVITSSDDQFWTNSTIIEGAHEVMLVDAQLTKTSAEKVLQEIKATNKPLSTIYITHEHADHFLGLEVFS